MKKWSFAALVAILALALMGCGDKKDPAGGPVNPKPTPSGDKYTVTFDLGGASGTAPAAIEVESGKAIGALPAAPSRTGYIFEGWAVEGAEIDEDFVVTKNITVTATWFNTAEGKIKVKYGNGTPDAIINFEAGTDTWADVKSENALKRPAWTDATKEFAGWFDTAATPKRWDAGASPQEDTAVLQEGTILVAKWASTVMDTTGASLKFASENGDVAIFKFTFPAGKTVADYEGVSVEIKVPEASLYKQIRNARVYGPYSLTTFQGNQGNKDGDDPWTGDFVTDANGTVVAKFDAGNATAIANDKGPSWYWDWAGVQGKTTAVADEWFTVVHPFGTGAGANPNGGYNAARLTNTETELYFGVGIQGTGVSFSGVAKTKAVADYYNAIVQAFREVKLIGKSGTADLVGVPGVSAAGKPMGAGYVDPIYFGWIGAPTAAIVPPSYPAFSCSCDPGDVHVDPCACGGDSCTCTVAVATCSGCAIEGKTKAEALADEIYCDCAGHPASCCDVCKAVGTGPLTELEITNPTPYLYGTTTVGARTVISVVSGELVFDVQELDFNASNRKAGTIENPYYGLTLAEIAALLDEDEGDLDIEDYLVDEEYVEASGASGVFAAIPGVWGGGGVWYELPDNYKSYTTLKIEYTGTQQTGSAGTSEVFFEDDGDGNYVAKAITFVNAQITPKQGQQSFTNPGTGGKYWNVGANQTQTLNIATEFTTAITDGISFQLNTWNDTNAPVKGTFKVTKLTLIP